jgi:hypothetical protein
MGQAQIDARKRVQEKRAKRRLERAAPYLLEYLEASIEHFGTFYDAGEECGTEPRFIEEARKLIASLKGG